ncbi:MAG TPA: acetate/propionate family kinase [Chloroflexota bacterium]|jgi:acetate kinase
MPVPTSRLASTRWLLVLNAGSSSLKYELFDATDATVARGEVSRLGQHPARHTLVVGAAPPRRAEGPCPDHRAAVDWALRELAGVLPAGWAERVAAAGHRVVHGGPSLWQPTRVDDAVEAELVRASELAPLHNGPSLAALRAARELLPAVQHVTVFDTGFHHDLPEVARVYALPTALAERWGIRRYGFHGTSCRYVVGRLGELGVAAGRLIVAHLGAGASLTAVRAGRSVDTSMGFTPLEGLVMGTRSGDLDPALPLFLERHAGLDAGAVERLLEHEAGLRGLGGRSGDYAELEALAAAGDGPAELALALFAYRARKYIGAYWAALGGVDLLVFTGGIGEHSAGARRRILAPLEAVGWRLDPARNADGPAERRLSPDRARPEIWVIPTREALQIAREARALIEPASPSRD